MDSDFLDHYHTMIEDHCQKSGLCNCYVFQNHQKTFFCADNRRSRYFQGIRLKIQGVEHAQDCSVSRDGQRHRHGSGHLKADGLFQIVAMEKEVQASNVHQHTFGERECLADKSSQALPECIIPALYMSCFTCFFAHCCMLLFWNDSLIYFPKICIAMPRSIRFWNRIPQFTTVIFTSISNCSSNNLSLFLHNTIYIQDLFDFLNTNDHSSSKSNVVASGSFALGSTSVSLNGGNLSAFF